MDEISRIQAVLERWGAEPIELKTEDKNRIAQFFLYEDEPITHDDVKLLLRCIIDGWKGE